MATVNQRGTIHGASPMPNSLDYYEKVVRVLLDRRRAAAKLMSAMCTSCATPGGGRER